jgi:hypothetical protein
LEGGACLGGGGCRFGFQMLGWLERVRVRKK